MKFPFLPALQVLSGMVITAAPLSDQSSTSGAEDALKRMPVDEGFSMITGLYYSEPMK